METRANHLLIGGFVLVVVAGLFAFVIWLAKVEIDREFAYYDIIFEAPVTGLGPASEVRFNGIVVGSVDSIAIDPEDISRVRVTVKVAETTPIREDTVAVVELQGLTGVSLVQLIGGSSRSPPLIAKDGQSRPVIASRPSRIDELVRGAPALIDRGTKLADRAAALFDDRNREAVTRTLASIATVAERLARRADEIERIVVSADKTMSDVAVAAQAFSDMAVRLEGLADDAEATLALVRGSMSGVDEVIDKDLRETMTEARRAAEAMARMSDSVSALVEDNREGLQVFTTEGLNEFARFITEARLLVSGIARISERIQDDPARFLFGNRKSEYEPE